MPISHPDRPPVLAVGGPTATGKSALALALAERVGGEIGNADALQVYRGFDIGTAKPSAEERRRVPHHLLDILDPHEPYSAGEFARRARLAIAAITERIRVPIVVGGSGLYWRALFTGLAPVPAGDPEVRRQLRGRLAADGLAALAAELARLAPPTAGRLPPAAPRGRPSWRAGTRRPRRGSPPATASECCAPSRWRSFPGARSRPGSH